MVKCPYCNCGQEFKKLTVNHLKTHGISWMEYLKEYREEDYYYEYVSKWIMDFYRPVKEKFIEQVCDKNKGEYGWRTIHALQSKTEKEELINKVKVASGEYKSLFKKRPWYFNRNDIVQHLKRERTVGVYTNENASYFLTFDIDVYNHRIVLSITQALKSLGIANDQILISFSGGKGYHVTIFFQKAISKKYLKTLFDIVLWRAGWLEENTRDNNTPIIEPRGTTDQGVKLPLSINRKKIDKDYGWFRLVNPKDNFCYLCNWLVNETNTLSKLESMKKIDVDVIMRIVNRYRSEVDRVIGGLDSRKIGERDTGGKELGGLGSEDEGNRAEEDIGKEIDEVIEDVDIKNFFKSNNDINRSIEVLLNKPIKSGNRNKTLLKIAVWNKSRGLTAEENEKFLIEFSRLEMHNFKTTAKENEKEIRDMMRVIYYSKNAHKYKVFASIQEVNYTKEDILEILSVKEEKLRKLYFVIFTHFKMYGDKQTKEFYMTYETISKLIKINGKEINKRILELEKLGKINILRKGEKDKANSLKRNLANKYYFVYDIKQELKYEKYKLLSQKGKLDNVIYTNFKMMCAKALTKREIQNEFKDYKSIIRYKYQKLQEAG